jgi:hypothetical protein
VAAYGEPNARDKPSSSSRDIAHMTGVSGCVVPCRWSDGDVNLSLAACQAGIVLSGEGLSIDAGG